MGGNASKVFPTPKRHPQFVSFVLLTALNVVTNRGNELFSLLHTISRNAPGNTLKGVGFIVIVLQKPFQLPGEWADGKTFLLDPHPSHIWLMS